MPVAPGKLIKYSIGGAVGSELWSINFWCRTNSTIATPTPAQMNTTAANSLSAFNTVVWSASSNGLKSGNTSDTTLSNSKLYFYDGGLLTVDGAASITPVAGTGTSAHPGYVASVCSLLTDYPGRSKRGRLYLPATGMGILTTTSQWASSTLTHGIVDNMRLFLQNGGIAPSWDGTAGIHPVIMSMSLGSITDVTGLRMDSLPDTQHGRTRRLVATDTYAVAYP